MDIIQAGPRTAQYVVLTANGVLTEERVLTGTANQVVLTDNGAGGTVVLSLPQDIHTAAAPTFESLTLSGASAAQLTLRNIGVPKWAITSTAGNLNFYDYSGTPGTRVTFDHTTGNVGIAGSLTLSGLTQGSVLFAGAGGLVSQDNASLYFDDNTNRLGVGITAPVGVFHVSTDINTENVHLDKWYTGTSGSSLLLRKGRGTQASPLRAKSGDVLGGLVAYGAEAADDVSAASFNSARPSGTIRILAAEDTTSTAHGGYAQIQTTAIGATSATERLRVSAAGNLSIGAGALEPSTGTLGLFFSDGTAPSSLASNTAGLYANDDVGTVKMYAIDEAGSAALLNYRSIALGGGAAPTFGTIGGSGPTTAAQNSWIELNIGGTAYWVPAWI